MSTKDKAKSEKPSEKPIPSVTRFPQGIILQTEDQPSIMIVNSGTGGATVHENGDITIQLNNRYAAFSYSDKDTEDEIAAKKKAYDEAVLGREKSLASVANEYLKQLGKDFVEITPEHIANLR